MNDENHIATSFDSFLENLSEQDSATKLFFTAGIVELLRHSKSAKTGLAIAELLVSLPVVEWSRIPFSITKTILSDKYKTLVKQLGVPAEFATDVLLSGLLAFLSRMQEQPPTEALLQEVVSDVAREVAESLKDEQPAADAKPAPELFNSWMVRRVFESGELTDDTVIKLGAQLVYFRAPLSPKTLGPEIRGVAFDNGTNQYYILLESGEFLKVSKDYEHLRIVTCDAWTVAPASLFLALGIAAQQLEMYAVISKPQLDYIAAGNLGKPLKPVVQAVANAEDVVALEHVFDIGREAARIGATGATGPTGATVRFPIPNTDFCVVLDANQDAHGPYSTARLVQANETGTDVVLMRHETPRLYSLRGVYLFPLKDQLISLTVMF